MAAFVGSPTSATVPPRAHPDHPEWRFLPFHYVHAAGPGTGEINLCTIPPGDWIFPAGESHFQVSQFAAGATLDIGTRAHLDKRHGAMVEDADRMMAAMDVASGAFDDVGPPTDEIAHLATAATAFATVANGNIEDGDTIEGWFTYAPYVEGD